MSNVYDYLIDNENSTKTSFSIFVAILYMMILYIQIVSRDVPLNDKTMFIFENISDLDRDWYLGGGIKKTGCIPKHLLQWITSYQIIGIQFLFENFMNQRNGAILNHDEVMNMQFQVSVFLISVKANISENTPVLVICADHLICKWHYHLNQVGLKVQIIMSEEFDQGEVFLVSAESLKLLKKLAYRTLFCVVLDEIDNVVTRKYISKVKGQFHIGLTRRNFIVNPDQKLKWSILNWANPGCFGKLNDFYRIDRSHSLAFADNYRLWWSRLTFKFCDSFEPPLENEIEEYQETLDKWGEEHGIKTNIPKIKTKRKLSICRENNTETTKRRIVKKAKKIEIIDELPNIQEENHYVERRIENKESASPVFIKNTTDNETKIDNHQELDSDDNDVLNMFNSSHEVKREKELSEDPLISIICSQESEGMISSKDNLLEDAGELSQVSSSNDSEFFSKLVKHGDKPFRSNRSQEISELINNLSDEENLEKKSDDDDFFSELISG